ncbi:agmatinase [Carboxylicivirga marina]|uniref:Agmatinase n=1 Tax=Carboxylicivirga marina TaxID=2800988 RepID=A0ABS1HLD5_9BACT|nr:agmatinase [Carboxylicivirga marina]MBK3518083.1 agmatinase [Carboxylicivirga marina]
MSIDFAKHFCGEDGYCLDYNEAKIVILPVPYDGTSTWIKGADKGPEAIIEASGTLEMYDIETESDISQKGIYTLPPISENTSPELMALAVENEVNNQFKSNKFTVLLGGEHSVSIGAFKAYSEKYNDLSILQLDAHADLRQKYEGSEYNHACAMYKAQEYAHIVQVGIRSMCQEEKAFVKTSNMFFRHQIRNNSSWKKDVLKKLKKNVYLTIDLDVFDTSIMPSTGTPEPDGLLFNDVIELVKTVANKVNIVGFDIVELCPNKDNKAPDYLAAKLIYKILSIIFKNR